MTERRSRRESENRISNRKEQEMARALLHASLHGREQEAIHLLKAGAPAAAVDKDGKTALHHGAERGMPKLLLTLISLGASLDDLDANGFSALALAAKGHLECVRILLEAGAAPTPARGARSDAGVAALARGRADIAEALAAHGWRPQHGQGALLEAVRSRSEEAVDAALRLGAPVDEQVGEKERTALMSAALIGDPSLIRKLLSAGASPSLKDRAGKTAKDHAAEFRGEARAECSHLLLAAEEACVLRGTPASAGGAAKIRGI